MNTTRLITKLAYESINDTYSHAEYGDFKVIMNIKTGYINATKLCADGGKQMKHWLENSSSKNLIECFENNQSESRPVLITDNSYGITRGTYAHPDLIPHIASWVSPKFAIKVSKIVNEFLIREREEVIRRLTGEKSELIKMLEESEKQRKNDHKESLKMLEEMKRQNEKTHIILDETQNTLDTVSSRIEIVIDEVVPPSIRVELHEEIGIMELNDSTSKYTHKVFCRQNKSANNAKSRILRDYPQATLFREINPSPNSKNFLHNLKDLYGTGTTPQLKIHYNYITMNGSNEELNEMINNVLDKAKTFGL